MNRPDNYIITHIHSMLSNGTTNVDSVTNFRDYVKAAKGCGMKAIAFTEHGNIFEWLHKKEEIERAGMKYIHGAEVYITDGIFDACGDIVKDRHHCVLLARNYDGVKEINRLTSSSFNREDKHFYSRPRITFDELFSTSKNVFVTSACLGSVLNEGSDESRIKFINFMANNKDRCWLEIQHHNCIEQIKYNAYLYELSKATGIPLIVGTDTHALNDRHMKGRALLQKAKDVHFSSEDEFDMTFKNINELMSAYELQIKTAKSQKEDYIPIESIYEAIEETNRLADMVEEFSVDHKPKYPRLYDNPEDVFRRKIQEGIVWRGIDKLPDNQKQIYLDKIEYEINTYKHNNAIDFMLLEEDYKSVMRRDGVRYGYSRGSVSGSIIAYILGITEIDSIKYNLNFERFMNTERISLADIDTDWYSEDRGKVREYLFNRAGLFCCDIVTFNTIAEKGSIRDICRGMFKENVERLPDDVRKEIEEIDKKNESLKKKAEKSGSSFKLVEYSDRLKRQIESHSVHKEVGADYKKTADEVISLYEQNPDKAKKKYPEIFDYLDIINGVIVSVGNHPAGCVVSPFPVDEWFGTFTTKTDIYPVSVLNMKEIDSLNFVKLDILGLTD